MTQREYTTPQQAWAALVAGNRRFMDDVREHPDQDARRRQALQQVQEPFATVFGCSDSRVAAEIVFDQGLGHLFVVRTAGQVLDTASLGSIEFGVANLGTPLLLVLGHERCGAVTATMQVFESGQMPTGFVRDLIERITPSVFRAFRGNRYSIDEIIAEHVRYTANLLVERSQVVAEAIAQGRLAVVGAVYNLDRGGIQPVHTIGEIG